MKLSSTKLLFLFLLGCGFLSLTLPASSSGIVITWHESMGVLPDDPSIPAVERFQISGDASMVSLLPDTMNISDTDGPSNVRIHRDISGDSIGDDWSFEATLRINSHSRDTLDWGARLRFDDGARSAMLAISEGSIGFLDASNNNYIATPYSTYMKEIRSVKIARVGEDIHVYTNLLAPPSLTVPYVDLPTTSSEFIEVAASSATENGISNFDILSFNYFSTQPKNDAAIPDLIYNAATGEVILDPDEGLILSYVLNNGYGSIPLGFRTTNFTPVLNGLVTNLDFELAESDFSGLTSPRSIGEVFPTGLDLAGLEAMLSDRRVMVGYGVSPVDFELIVIGDSPAVPEPSTYALAAFSLLGLGLFARRQRR